jgi:hypothetical protein
MLKQHAPKIIEEMDELRTSVPTLQVNGVNGAPHAQGEDDEEEDDDEQCEISATHTTPMLMQS